MTTAHLGWIPVSASIGFATAFLFGDLLTLPVDVYYAIYFAVILAFLGVYARTTGLVMRDWLSRRLAMALVLGVIGGLFLMRGVLARPATARLSGLRLWWALLWRGLAYGSVDGLLLLAFPWIVTWRALHGDGRRGVGRLGVGLVAWVAILFVTTAYHLGYADFRSEKILQPDVGSAIGGLPTVLSANPLASPVSHVFLHITAVLHSPDTGLFLPPHRSGDRTVPQGP